MALSKPCNFLCGSYKGVTKCPCDPEVIIEWERADGSADQLCARVFANKYSHITTRDNLRLEMGRDKNKHNQFLNYRDQLIDRIKAGYKGFVRKQRDRPPGEGSRCLKKRRVHSEQLLPPALDVLPIEVYRNRFDEKLMKKAGHYIKKVHGKQVVVMPPAEDALWKLQPVYTNEHVQEETLEKSDSEHGSGLESGDDVIDDKFNDLVEIAEAKRKEASKGLSFAEICALAEKAEAEKQSRPSTGETEQTEVDPTDGVSLKDQARKRKRKRDTIESDDEPTPKVSPKSKETRKSGKSHTPSKGVGQKNKSQSSGGSAGRAQESNEDGQTGPKREAGRPKKTQEENADREISYFNQASSSSNFFNENAWTSQRCLKRYIEGAETAERVVKEDEKNTHVGIQLRFHKRRLQYIETGVRLGMTWVGSAVLSVRVQKFMSLWQGLRSFCECEPVVPMECEHLWTLYMEVQVSRLDCKPNLLEELDASTLQARFPSRKDQVVSMQRHYLSMFVVNILSSTHLDLQEAGDFLQVLKQCLPIVGSTTLQEEVQKTYKLAQGVPQICRPHEIAELEAVLGCLERKESEGLLLDEFRKHMRLGRHFIDSAKKQLEDAKEYLKTVEAVQEHTAVGREAMKQPIQAFCTPNKALLIMDRYWADRDTAMWDRVYQANREQAQGYSDVISSLAKRQVAGMLLSWQNVFSEIHAPAKVPIDETSLVSACNTALSMQCVKTLLAQENVQAEKALESVRSWMVAIPWIQKASSRPEELTPPEISSVLALEISAIQTCVTELRNVEVFEDKDIENINADAIMVDMQKNVLERLSDLLSESTKGDQTCVDDAYKLCKSALSETDEVKCEEVRAVDIKGSVEAMMVKVAGTGHEAKLDFLNRSVQVIKLGICSLHYERTPLQNIVDMEHVKNTLLEFQRSSDVFKELTWPIGQGTLEQDFTMIKEWCAKLHKSRADSWIADITECGELLKSALPPSKTIDDKRALKEDEIRRVITKHPQNEQWVEMANNLTTKLTQLKKIQDAGVSMSNELRKAHSDGLKTKKIGKMAIGVSFVLSKLEPMDKADPQALKKCAETCKSKIERMKIELPAYLATTLDLMQNPQAQS